ncbi:MAG: hypothetical protein LBE37_19300 [Sphingobacterium sp.]|jgi:hypothetical protein|nr:hypothetical protein [Sphingobacterium sp.]
MNKQSKIATKLIYPLLPCHGHRKLGVGMNAYGKMKESYLSTSQRETLDLK